MQHRLGQTAGVLQFRRHLKKANPNRRLNASSALGLCWDSGSHCLTTSLSHWLVSALFNPCLNKLSFKPEGRHFKVLRCRRRVVLEMCYRSLPAWLELQTGWSNVVLRGCPGRPEYNEIVGSSYRTKKLTLPADNINSAKSRQRANIKRRLNYLSLLDKPISHKKKKKKKKDSASYRERIRRASPHHWAIYLTCRWHGVDKIGKTNVTNKHYGTISHAAIARNTWCDCLPSFRRLKAQMIRTWNGLKNWNVSRAFDFSIDVGRTRPHK